MKSVLYGINPATEICYAQFDDPSTLLYATTTGDKDYRGQKVHSLGELAALDRKDIERVIICSMQVSQIATDLLEHGFNIQQIFYFDLLKEKVFPCAVSKNKAITKGDVLYAFYDLACNVPTYDVLVFAMLAEVERKILGKKYIHFCIVPNISFDENYINIQNLFAEEDTQWRVDHILKPLFKCIPSTRGVSHFAAREEAQYIVDDKEVTCFPTGYTPDSSGAHFSYLDLKKAVNKGHAVSALQAPAQARQLVDDFLEEKANGRKIVLCTIREYGALEFRNTKLDEWSKFLHELDPDEYFPVIIRDTYKCTTSSPPEISGFEEFPTASIDPCVRVALIEKAYINLSSSTGPGLVPFLIPGAAFINFMPVRENCPISTVEVFEGMGMPVGEPPFFRDNDYQWIGWCEETYENLKVNFNKLAGLLEARGQQ